MAVSRRDLLLGGLVVGGAVLAIASSGSKKRSPTSTGNGSGDGGSSVDPPVPGYHWVDADAPRRIRMIAAPLELSTGMFGFGDFLAAIAYLESRGNSQAGSNAGNAARGWFGMRPESARVKDAGLPASALKNERQAVALAFWYGWRLRPYASPGQVIDRLALRRGWGYPFLVNDVDEQKTTPQNRTPGAYSRAVRENLVHGYQAVDVDPQVMYEAAFTSGYTWPGIHNALQIVGAPGGAIA